MENRLRERTPSHWRGIVIQEPSQTARVAQCDWQRISVLCRADGEKVVVKNQPRIARKLRLIEDRSGVDRRLAGRKPATKAAGL